MNLIKVLIKILHEKTEGIEFFDEKDNKVF